MNIKYLCAALALVGLAGCQYTSPDVAVQTSNAGNEYISPAEFYRLNASLPNTPAALAGLDGVNVDGFAVGADGKMYFSIDHDTTVAGTYIRKGDVFRCDVADCTTLTKVIDVTAIAELPNHINIDAITINRTSNRLYYSTDVGYTATRSTLVLGTLVDVDYYISGSDVMFINLGLGILQLGDPRVFNGSLLQAQGANVDALNWSATSGNPLEIGIDVSAKLPKTGGGDVVVTDRDLLRVTGNGNTATYQNVHTLINTDGVDVDAVHNYVESTTPGGDAIFSNGFETPSP